MRNEQETPKKGRALGFNEYIDAFITSNLNPVFEKISEKNIQLKDPRLDLALDKLGKAMTILQERSMSLKKEGTHAED